MIKTWQASATEDADIRAELQAILSGTMIEGDRFSGRLAFGTGGLRGVIGAGTNRMNIYTVRQATQGLASYLLKSSETPCVAIAYDSRMKSRLFAEQTARVLAANRITAYLYPRQMPTPALSFAVRYLHCDAGVCITASHNPSQYNGYKVYESSGCQITTEAAAAISLDIEAADPFSVALCPFDPETNPYIRYIDEAVVEAYLKAIMKQRLSPMVEAPLKIVYSPLNGTGRECVTRILHLGGYDEMRMVPEQEMPDGRFTTCPSPNPEEESAMALCIALAKGERADLALATDPDCDRVGLAAYDGSRYVRINGNELGVLLLDYICSTRAQRLNMPRNPIAIKTIVTSEMADCIAQSYGVSVLNVLTGFKFIGEQIGLLEKQDALSRFIFGFEESCGYLTGPYVRDKDAVGAVLMICDMAAYHKNRHQTLPDVLEELYRQYGYHLSSLDSFTFPGAEGNRRMERFMSRLREDPQSLITNEIASVIDYASGVVRAPDQPALPASDVLQLRFSGGSLVTIRPSGTEPKLKLYCAVKAGDRHSAQARLQTLRAEFSAMISRDEAQEKSH